MLPPIKGLQKSTLIDFPGRLACTIFLPGCNFRCGYCYNKDLVCNPSIIPSISEHELFSFLQQRKNVLEGVCITGGEPTLYGERLVALCREIKKLGYLVKLDTNGTHPSLLKKLLGECLVDYIAMDVKNSLETYDEVTGVVSPLSLIKKSIMLIKSSDIEHEFRTTIVPDCFNEDSMWKIGELVQGAHTFSIQQFSPAPQTIDPKYSSMEPQPAERLERYKAIMSMFVSEVTIKNTP
jgi:pyruvate formate lyase activating enzyme